MDEKINWRKLLGTAAVVGTIAFAPIKAHAAGTEQQWEQALNRVWHDLSPKQRQELRQDERDWIKWKEKLPDDQRYRAIQSRVDYLTQFSNDPKLAGMAKDSEAAMKQAGTWVAQDDNRMAKPEAAPTALDTATSEEQAEDQLQAKVNALDAEMTKAWEALSPAAQDKLKTEQEAWTKDREAHDSYQYDIQALRQRIPYLLDIGKREKDAGIQAPAAPETRMDVPTPGALYFDPTTGAPVSGPTQAEQHAAREKWLADWRPYAAKPVVVPTSNVRGLQGAVEDCIKNYKQEYPIAVIRNIEYGKPSESTGVIPLSNNRTAEIPAGTTVYPVRMTNLTGYLGYYRWNNWGSGALRTTFLLYQDSFGDWKSVTANMEGFSAQQTKELISKLEPIQTSSTNLPGDLQERPKDWQVYHSPKHSEVGG